MMDASLATSALSDDGECVSRTSEQWELDYYGEIEALAYSDLSSVTAEAVHQLVPDGTIGAEYRSMKASAMEAEMRGTPRRDPYHGMSVEPRASREPPRESFKVMVVGESGLGKTTLLESFFKSFRDDDATIAMLQRRETQKVIETRLAFDEAAARRDKSEREMKAAAETGQYALAQARQEENARLSTEVAALGDRLKALQAADERRRRELQSLREVRALATRRPHPIPPPPAPGRPIRVAGGTRFAHRDEASGGRAAVRNGGGEAGAGDGDGRRVRRPQARAAGDARRRACRGLWSARRLRRQGAR